MKKLLLAACVLLPATAGAGGLEVFAGYAFAQRYGDSEHGVRAGADLGVDGPLALEVAAGAQRRGLGSSTATDYTLMAGPRIAGTGKIAPFAAFTAGVIRTNVDTGRLSSHDTEPVAALDVGIDVALGSRWALRAQAGLQFTKDGETFVDAPADAWESSPRGSAAIVWRPGR